MTKISTDKGVVNDLTNQFTDSLSEVTFLPEKSFSFSQSSSVSGLMKRRFWYRILPVYIKDKEKS